MWFIRELVVANFPFPPLEIRALQIVHKALFPSSESLKNIQTFDFFGLLIFH